MFRATATRFALAACAVALAAPTGAHAAVSPMQQVNADGESFYTRLRPRLEANPADPSHLVLADSKRTATGALLGTCMVHASFNGGATWASTVLPVPAGHGCRVFPGPEVAFGKNGLVYAAYYSIPTSVAQPVALPAPPPEAPDPRGFVPRFGPQGRVLVARSSDGGRSFGAPVTVSTVFEHLAQDAGYALGPTLPFVSVGPAAPGSSPIVTGFLSASAGGSTTLPISMSLEADPVSGNVYVAWDLSTPATVSVSAALTVPGGPGAGGFLFHRIRPMWFSRSTDGGATFSQPTPIMPPAGEIPTRNGSITSPAMAISGGKLYLAGAWLSCLNPYEQYVGGCYWLRVVFTSSSDGGASFSAPRTVREIVQYNFSGLRIPKVSVAAQPDDASRVYIAYEDEFAGPTTSDVFVLGSSDGGASFAHPVRPATTAPDAAYPHERPEVAVSPGGRVHVAWYDGRNDETSRAPCRAFAAGDPPNCTAGRDVYYAYSDDLGATFGPNVRVTPASFTATTRTLRHNGSVGDAALGSIGILPVGQAAKVVWEHSRPHLVPKPDGTTSHFEIWDLKTASIT